MKGMLPRATDLKARSNAALTSAVHARIRAAEPLPGGAASAVPPAPEPFTRGRFVLSVVQWTVLAAAIAAPWVLLLTP
jgi:hypothetical protein